MHIQAHLCYKARSYMPRWPVYLLHIITETIDISEVIRKCGLCQKEFNLYCGEEIIRQFVMAECFI